MHRQHCLEGPMVSRHINKGIGQRFGAICTQASSTCLAVGSACVGAIDPWAIVRAKWDGDAVAAKGRVSRAIDSSMVLKRLQFIGHNKRTSVLEPKSACRTSVSNNLLAVTLDATAHPAAPD